MIEFINSAVGLTAAIPVIISAGSVEKRTFQVEIMGMFKLSDVSNNRLTKYCRPYTDLNIYSSRSFQYRPSIIEVHRLHMFC